MHCWLRGTVVLPVLVHAPPLRWTLLAELCRVCNTSPVSATVSSSRHLTPCCYQRLNWARPDGSVVRQCCLSSMLPSVWNQHPCDMRENRQMESCFLTSRVARITHACMHARTRTHARREGRREIRSGWDCSSVVEHLPSTYKGRVPSPTK